MKGGLKASLDGFVAVLLTRLLMEKLVWSNAGSDTCPCLAPCGRPSKVSCREELSLCTIISTCGLSEFHRLCELTDPDAGRMLAAVSGFKVDFRA